MNEKGHFDKDFVESLAVIQYMLGTLMHIGRQIEQEQNLPFWKKVENMDEQEAAALSYSKL